MLRFAISPTKPLDIQDLRVAILNYIVSKQKNEDLVIRIDDCDKQKNIEGNDKEILELISLFSIEYKYCNYQSDNLKYHQKLAMQFMMQKKAFACFCNEKKIEISKQKAKEENKSYSYNGNCQNLSDDEVINNELPFSVRVALPKNNILVSDIIKGDIEFSPKDVDSFKILNEDKTPTHNYATAIDDMLIDISLIIKTEDDLDNTPKQVHIRDLIGYDKVLNYAHIPLIKSQPLSVKSLIDEGYLPIAIANYLVSLGFETPKEIFEIEEAINWLDISKISKSSIVFDFEKLKEINKKHLENFDEMRLSKILGYADSDLGNLAKLYLVDCSTLNEIKEKIKLYFEPKVELALYSKEITQIKECIIKAPFFNNFNEFKNHIEYNTNLNDDKLLPSLNYLITGSLTGPKLEDIYPCIKNYIGEIVK